jgi:hypothetical protein
MLHYSFFLLLFYSVDQSTLLLSLFTAFQHSTIVQDHSGNLFVQPHLSTTSGVAHQKIIIGFKPGLWANGSARKPAASILPWPKYCP